MSTYSVFFSPVFLRMKRVFLIAVLLLSSVWCLESIGTDSDRADEANDDDVLEV